jgi:hypothetical protein
MPRVEQIHEADQESRIDVYVGHDGGALRGAWWQFFP